MQKTKNMHFSPAMVLGNGFPSKACLRLGWKRTAQGISFRISETPSVKLSKGFQVRERRQGPSLTLPECKRFEPSHQGPEQNYDSENRTMGSLQRPKHGQAFLKEVLRARCLSLDICLFGRYSPTCRMRRMWGHPPSAVC